MPESNKIESLFFTNIEPTNKSHTAILQTLNRDIGGYYFTAEAFQKNVTAWQNIPIVYAVDHPDMKLFAENPQLALDKIKGRVVGNVTIPNIETAGHPRLMGNLEITDDEVNKLIDDGRLSHSTGFLGYVNDNKQVTDVTPNHVLVFIEDANNIPKDRGAFILNKEDTPKSDSPPETITGMIHKEQSEMTELIELTKQLEISNKEKETLTSELEAVKTELGKASEQLKVFAQKEAEALKATREAQWQTIKKSIPIGLTHKAEDEQKLRTQFEADPYSFAVKLTEFKNKVPVSTQEEGVEFQNQDEMDEEKVVQAAIDELRTAGGRTRRRV